MTYIPTRNEVKQHVESLISELVKFAKTEFDVEVSSLSPVIRFRDTQIIGRAGVDQYSRPQMNLNLYRLVTYPVVLYSEYKSLAGIPSIGSFRTTNWKEWLDALVLHEFAHVVQFSLKRQRTSLRIKGDTFERLGEFENGHGVFFQRIYSILRRRYLNDRIKHEAIVGQAFDAPAIQRKERPKIVADNPYLGRVAMIHGQRFTVVEIHPRNHKYPLIVSNGKTRYKISINHLTEAA